MLIGGIEETVKSTDVEYVTDVDIYSLSTIGIHSTVDILATPKTTEELSRLVGALSFIGAPYRVVGGMSNLLPRDTVYRGVLINTRKIQTKTVAENRITAGCGVRLSDIVRTLIKNRLGGMAQLYHIPGTLGGSVLGNAGAHGLEISDVIESADVYFPDVNTVKTLTARELNFGYRTSRIKTEGGVVLSATLCATPRDINDTKAEIEHFGMLRQNQPRGVRTLGSTFKRVGSVSAGYYIDQCGLKGFAVGGAAVSDIHAGFIINRAEATSKDVITLIGIIKERVFVRFGILLEEEIDYL